MSRQNNPYGYDPIVRGRYQTFDLPDELPAPFYRCKWVAAILPNHTMSHDVLVFEHPDLNSSAAPANQVQEHVFFCGQWHRKLSHSYFAFILGFFLGLEQQKNPVLWISPIIKDGFPRLHMFYFSVRADLVAQQESITNLTRRISFDYSFYNPRNHHNPHNRKLIINFYETEGIPRNFVREVRGLPRSPLVLENTELDNPNLLSCYRLFGAPQPPSPVGSEEANNAAPPLYQTSNQLWD